MSKQPASTLRCPSCGAPATPDAARCEYCRARLATVSCPSCFGLLFDGAAYCPYCGVARSRSEKLDSQPMRCPACRANMHWVSVGSTDLLECEGCDGTWIEAATFQRLCADRESQAAVLQKARPDSKTLTQAGRVRYRPCPRCRKLMNRMNFGRLSGAIVDVCRGHGTFLDRGELHDVVSFILEGGMDRMRQLERDDFKEEQRRLHESQFQQARIAPTGPTPAWSQNALQMFLTALLSDD